MGYFDTATMTISEIGNYGNHKLSGDAFARDDRAKRIDRAAGALCDWVFEYLSEVEGNGEYGNMGIFRAPASNSTHVAIAMVAQFERDQTMEAHLIEGLLDKSSGKGAP
jgi:hypothetical protein